MSDVAYDRNELGGLDPSILERVDEIRSGPAPLALQALIEIVHHKLEIHARLRVVAFQARSDGDEDDANVLGTVARAEQEQIVELLGAIRRHLNAMGPPLQVIG